MYLQVVVLWLLTCFTSCYGGPMSLIKAAIRCDKGVGSGLELCPGTGPRITEKACLHLGCCWSTLPNKQQQHCVIPVDNGKEFELEIENEYHKVVQEDPPYFKIDLAGDFFAYEREEFSPECTEELGSVMISRAQEMINPVNTRIGVDFCLYKTTEDVRVISTSSSVTTEGSEGIATNSFVMSIAGNQTMGDVQMCATEISMFLEDHLNWGVPILPPPQGCPLPVFYDSDFTNIGDNWVCLDSINTAKLTKVERLQQFTENTLGYEISLAGDFVTFNGIPLEAQCTAAYSNQFLQETIQMVTQVNALIGNQLCSNYPGIVLSTATAALSSNGNLGYTRSSFLASMDESVYFEWVYACGLELSAYLQDFNNWGTPILDQIPGCPIVIFQGNGFEETDQTWICL